MQPRTSAAVACLLLAWGCGEETTARRSSSGSGGASSSSRVAVTSTSQGAGGGQACQHEVLPLLVRDYDGTERYYISARIDGRDVALHVDTGSGISFIEQPTTEPDFTPDVANVDLGCETLSFPGRGVGVRNDTIEGREVVGVLGADYFLAAPTRIDAAEREIRRLTPAALEASAAGAIPITFDDVLSHILVPVVLDGQARRLMFDTGGSTLHVGVDGQPGDEEVQVVDAEGTVFTVYLGSATLAANELPERTVPILRAPDFPYFEATVDALGGNLHGLLGLEAFPGEAIVVDGATQRLFIVP